MFADNRHTRRLITCGIALLVLASPRALVAHPPVSVVITADGRAYFSDLNNIWVLEPDGTFRIAVRGVHTHELWLDEHGALNGDDVQNEGDRYRFRTWRLLVDGNVESASEWRAGHPRNLGYSLTERAGSGRYWAIGSGGEVRLNDTTGQAFASITLGADPVAPSWVVATGSGALVVQGGRLLHVSPDGEARTLADSLIERTPDFAWVHDRHGLMKPWTDREGRIYVPVYAGQRVVRLSPDGSSPEVVVTSAPGWSPVGGTFDAAGALLLLEWSRDNQPRLRRIDPSGAETIYGPPG